MRIRYQKYLLAKVVKDSISFAEVINRLGLVCSGSSYKTVKGHISFYNIDISHFLGKGHLKGKKHQWSREMPLSQLLTKNSKHSRGNIKRRLIKEGIFKYECSICGLSEWRNEPLSLHIDHINGISDDNRLENLRLLCPNCHSQTDNFAGRNVRDRNRCVSCDTTISPKATRCKSCAGKQNSRLKIEWPVTENLIKMVKNSSYSAVARNLGVSDNAVRKRIKNHPVSCQTKK